MHTMFVSWMQAHAVLNILSITSVISVKKIVHNNLIRWKV